MTKRSESDSDTDVNPTIRAALITARATVVAAVIGASSGLLVVFLAAGPATDRALESEETRVSELQLTANSALQLWFGSLLASTLGSSAAFGGAVVRS